MSVASRPLTALLAHGKNWELPIPTDPARLMPSFDTRLTAEAAGILFTQGIGTTTFDRIILSTGYTAGPDHPSEALAMKRVIRERFDASHIPDEAIIMEEDSFDTPGNLTNANALCKKHGIGSIALLTVGYHLPRTRKLASRLLDDVQVIRAIKSESVIKQDRCATGRFYARSIVDQSIERRSVRPVARTISSLVLEGVAWTLLLVDHTGQGISRDLTTRARHQISA